MYCFVLQVPSAVLEVAYQNISSTSIRVSWLPPLSPNGWITHYTVYGLNLRTNKALKWETNNTNIVISGAYVYALSERNNNHFRAHKSKEYINLPHGWLSFVVRFCGKVTNSNI